MNCCSSNSIENIYLRFLEILSLCNLAWPVMFRFQLLTYTMFNLIFLILFTNTNFKAAFIL